MLSEGGSGAQVSFEELVARERVAFDRMTDRMVLGSSGLEAGELMRLAENAERWVYENKCANECEHFFDEAPVRPARCPFFKADRGGRRTCAGFRKDKAARALREWEDFREKALAFQEDLRAYRETGELPSRKRG